MASTVSISSLSSHLGYWLRYVSNHVSHAFARKLEEQGVTVAEWVVMRELYDAGPLAPSRLAERLGLTRGAISKLADRLEGKALLSREEDLADLRAQSLSLSERGHELVPRLAAIADQNDAQFFGHLTSDERAAVERIMRSVIERRGLSSVPIS